MADERIDIEFEQIVPWNGANDTGRDVRLKWQRNFERVKTALNLLGKQLDDDYLRKDKDDRTPHLLSSDKGFEVGEFVTGESGGKVWLDEETLKVLLELDRILVRDHIVIGDALLEYDAENKAVRVRHRDIEENQDTGEERETTEPVRIGFYAEGFVSAKGASSDGQGGGGGASALYQLNDVLKNEAGDGVLGAARDKVLMFDGTHWYAGDAKGKVVAVKVGETEYKPSEEGLVTLPEFAKVVDKTITVDKFIGDLQGNADTATKLKNALTIQKNGVLIGSFDGSEAKVVNMEVPTKVSQLDNDSKYLTEHQKLYALTIQGNGKQIGVYTPNEAAKSINITPSGIGAAASSHTHTISDVTNLQDSLESKLNASIFTELFEKVLLSDGVTYAIRAKYGFYSDSFVSAKGANPSSGGSSGGAASIYVGSTLYTPDGEGIIHLPAYPTVPTALKNPYALTIQKNGITQGVYDGSVAKTANITVPTKVSELTNDVHYLTSHQTIYALTIKGNGTELGVYTPNSAAKSINITAAGIGAAAATHKQAYTADACTTYTTDNENMGVTPAAVKKAIGLFEPKSHTHTISQVTDLAATLAKYYDSTISRIANTVLAAPNGSNGSATFRKLVAADIPSLDWSKITSGKPTTLAGYGITDGVNSVTVSGSGNAVTSASVSGHGLTLTKGETFLAKSIFDDLFEKVLLSDGVTYAIRAKYGFYSDSFVSAKGANSSEGGSTGGAASIYLGSDLYTPDSEGIIHLPAYPTVPTSLKNPYALTIQANGITQVVYDGSAAKTANITVPTKVSELTNDVHYLTSHQTIYALTIKGNGTELGVYTPNAAAKSINITAAGIGAAAATHTHTIAQVTGLQEALSGKYSSTAARTANTVLAAPNGSDGAAYFRKLVMADLPDEVRKFTDLDLSYYDYAYFVIGLFCISDTYMGGKGTSQGTVYITRNVGSQWVINADYAISNLYSSKEVVAENQKVKFTLRQMRIDSTFKPCTFLYNGKKYAGLVWEKAPSPSQIRVFNVIAQCDPFFVRYYVKEHNDKPSTILNSEIYESLRIDDEDIDKEDEKIGEQLFGNLEVINGNITADEFIGTAQYAGTLHRYQQIDDVDNPIWGVEDGYSINYNTFITNASNKPIGVDNDANLVMNIQHGKHDGIGQYGWQVGFFNSLNAPYVRLWTNGSHGSWRKLLHSGNYNEFAPSLTGAGASGTWSISVSGNAASATKLKTSRKIWGQTFDGSADVSGALTGVTSITIGDCVITYDSANKGLKFSTGIYSEQYVSAKGANSSEGGSTGGAASIYVGSTLYTPDTEGIIHLPAYPTVPTSLKNPYSLTIQANGTTLGIYDGSAAKTVNLTYANVGAAAANHKQAYTADECTTYATDYNTMGVTPAAVKKAIGLFEPKAHTHNVLGTVTAGSSSNPVYFNAGVPTAVDKTATFNALVNSITVGSATPKDEDYYISQYSGGGTTTTTYHRRPHSALYAYLKGKAEGTWGISISGNAATATKLQTARTLWGKSFDGTANVSGAISNTGTITPSATHTYNIGSSSLVYERSYVRYIDTDTGYYLRICAQGNEAITVKTDGCVGIGITPSYKLDVDGIIHTTSGINSEGQIYVASSVYPIKIKRTSAYGALIQHFSSNQETNCWLSGMAGSSEGNVYGFYYSTSAGSSNTKCAWIDTNGNFATIGGVTAKASSSDIRLKQDLTEYDALSIVRSHRSVKYHWNMTAKKNSAIFDDDDWHYGLIAQELQREHPQLVKDVFGDYLTIDYERLIPILWRAVQQLAKRNEELEMKLNEERRA